MVRTRVDQLLEIIARGYDRRSWHGTNLRGSIRGLDAGVAVRRPAPGRHNIWELVVHAAYWKYAVTRRITGGQRGSFPVEGSNWFERPARDATDEAAWRRDIALLATTHAQLVRAVGELDDRRLDAVAPGGKTTVFELVAGIAAHDLYHAGQIQLIKRLVARR